MVLRKQWTVNYYLNFIEAYSFICIFQADVLNVKQQKQILFLLKKKNLKRIFIKNSKAVSLFGKPFGFLFVGSIFLVGGNYDFLSELSQFNISSNMLLGILYHKEFYFLKQYENYVVQYNLNKQLIHLSLVFSLFRYVITYLFYMFFFKKLVLFNKLTLIIKKNGHIKSSL